MKFFSPFKKLIKIIKGKHNINHLKKLEKTFRSTRQIRKLIETKGQAGTFDPREKKKIK